MKDFKIYIGQTETAMIEILRASLKDDSSAESFPLRHINSTGFYYPSRFLKIVPLTAHSTSYHISIWHVTLSGIADEGFVKDISVKYEEHRETAALRHILKHLRTRRLLVAYKAILTSTNLQVEHPLITRLHGSLVSDGNWSETEKVVELAAGSSLFDDFLASSQPHSVWKRIHAADADGDMPSRRGGHAMCIDDEGRVIYLFGGWDGRRSLDDFWAYSIAEGRWKLLSRHSSEGANGPSPRSCHKMIFDGKTGCIYLLGRLSDGDPDDIADASRTQQASGDRQTETSVEYPADFFRYHTQGPIAGSWELLSSDTSSAGGPPLVFDHQMAMDSAAQILYVGGGRVNDGSYTIKYSGLYSYEPNERCLYIFAGMEEGEKYLSDMYVYDIDSNTATEIFSDFTTAGGPDKTFTQRAVMDPSLQEIYVSVSSQRNVYILSSIHSLCGLTRSRTNSLPHLDGTNWLYRYGEQPGTWTQIFSKEPAEDAAEAIEQPRTRYAHQVVYDMRSRTIYMHGGNAGRFREMCNQVPAVHALKFLQRDVADVVDHGSAETDTFQELLSHLLTMQATGGSGESMVIEPDETAVEGEKRTYTTISPEVLQQRTRVFEALTAYFPADAKEPGSNLVDMIDWYEESNHD
ncbi:Muskelin N-terminus-domain-containing protein [Amylostereum chailletii]|nr:Muskelin N-terminus-domain-containing protein [Amylostereum chailletii]